MSPDKSFLGTGWSFPPAFDVTRRSVVLAGEEEDIGQSLHILLGTVPGERVMHPTFGCGVRRMVFEHVTESTLTELKDIVRNAVMFFEPRIVLDGVVVNTDELFEYGKLLLRLDYTVRSTNTRTNLVYPLYLLEARNAAAVTALAA